MPTIRGWKSVAGPPAPVSWERREYLSPDRQWNVIYHTPREWHMGADGWQVQLLHEGHDVRRQHRELSRLAGAKGFRCEVDLQPWSHDSKALVFLTWDDDPVHIYNVAAKSLHHVPCGSGFIRSVQWSPDIDRLLVTSGTGALLVDQSGKWRGSATWRLASDEHPHTYWTQTGKWFFLLARESASGRVKLTFYAGEDGAPGDACDLDPRDLVPYDAEHYGDLPRGRFSLVVTSSMRSVGLLLDTWHSVQFHQPSATLYLAVYRPVSPVYRLNGEQLCNVEERWVAVELAT